MLAWCTGITSLTGAKQGVCLRFETGGVDDQESVHSQSVKIKGCKPMCFVWLVFFFLNEIFPTIPLICND